MQTLNTSTKDKKADIGSVYDVGTYERTEFGTIRTVTIDGEPRFVASDVAKALGYANPRDAVLKHCRWVAKCDVPHPQSKDKTLEVSVIPESDLYRLIARSQLPEAEKFESWIFDEVLPSIRKNGGYIANQEELSPEEIVANALIVANNIIAQKEKELEEKRRKLAILTHVNKTYTMTEIAKELNMKSAIQLNKVLAEMKIQYKVNDTWVFYSDYSNLGYEEIKQEILDSGRVVYHRKITQLGREFILGLFKEQQTA